jgi:hypothetical protein
MRPLLITVLKNIGAYVALAAFYHSPDLAFRAFRQSLVWQVEYTVLYWMSVPAFCLLIGWLNWRKRPEHVADLAGRILFTITLPICAIWHWLFTGWFIGHRS